MILTKNCKLCLVLWIISVTNVACRKESNVQNIAESSDTDVELICPDASFLDDEECRFECPDGWDRDDEGNCIPPCFQSWKKSGELCISECPDSMELVEEGPACRLPSSTVGSSNCATGTYDISGSEDSERVIFVNAGSGNDNGDGTEVFPYETITGSLSSFSENDTYVSMVLSSGQYTVENNITLPEGLRTLGIYGVCSESTTLILDGGSWMVEFPSVNLEIARVNLSQGIQIVDLNQLYIHDTVFKGDGINLDWNSPKKNGQFIARRNTFDCLNLEGITHAEVEGNFFRECETPALNVTDVDEFQIVGNWFESLGWDAINISSENDSNGTVENNWISEVANSGVFLIGNFERLSVVNNSFSGIGGNAIWMDSTSNIEVSGLRLAGQGETGFGNIPIFISESSNVTISKSMIVDSGESGVRVTWNSQDVIIEDSYIQGIVDGGGVMVDRGAHGIIVDSCILKSNKIGVDVREGNVQVINTMIGKNSAQGIRLKEVDGSLIENNVIAGNGSTGIELSLLKGDSSSNYALNNNTLVENVGLGILLRSGGESVISMDSNNVIGTRIGTIQNAQGQSDIGDGIAILTGTDNVASHATLTANRIGGNMRLGVIVHGQNTTADVNDNQFDHGNGYGNLIEEIRDQSADLLYQNTAVLTGPDSDKAINLKEGIKVADDMIGPGGDPTK